MIDAAWTKSGSTLAGAVRTGGGRPTNGGKAAGAAAPAERVVLVHCSASSARQWKALEELLTGFDAVAIDLHGHGDRERWRGARPLTLAEEAAAIEETRLDDAPFHLVGHSYGGAVALNFALRFPERLRSLTLIEPSCFHILKTAAKEDADSLLEVQTLADAVNRGVVCGDYRSGMARFIDYWGGAGSWEQLPAAKQGQFGQMALHVAHHFWSLIEEKTTLDDYAGIDVPTLILCGTRSPRPSRVITRLLAEAMPRARHRTIGHAGHMSPLTHTAEVNAFILDHLLRNGGRRVAMQAGTEFADLEPAGCA